MRILIVFIFLLAAQVLPCHAQEVPFRKFGLDNGLPSNRVYSFTQDRDGYIWIATEGGVVKYNGYSFKVFTTRDGLPSSDVWKVQEDRYGRKWLHCYANELGYIKNDKYYKINYKFTKLFKPSNLVDYGDRIAMSYSKDDKYVIILIDKNDNVTTENSLNGYGLKILTPDKKMYFDNSDGAIVWMKYVDGRFLFVDSLCKNYNAGFNTRVEGVMNNMLVSYNVNAPVFSVYNMKTCIESRYSLMDFGADKDEGIVVLYASPDSMYLFSNKAIYDFDKNCALRKRSVYYQQFRDTPLVVSRFVDSSSNYWYGTLDGSGLMVPHKQLLLKKNSTIIGGENLLFRSIISDSVICWYHRKLNKPVFAAGGKLINLQLPNSSLFETAVDYTDNKWLIAYRNGLYSYDVDGKGLHDLLDKKVVIYDSAFGIPYLKVSNRITGKPGWYQISDSMKGVVFIGARNIIRQGANRILIMSSDKVHEIQLNNSNDTIILRDVHSGRFLYCYSLDKLGLYIHYNNKNFVIADYNKDKYYRYDETFLLKCGIKDILNIKSDKYDNLYIQTKNKIYSFNLSTFIIDEVVFPFQLAEALMQVHGDYIVLVGQGGIAFRKILGKSSFGELYTIPQLNNTYFNQVYDFTIDKNGVVYINSDKGLYTDSVSNIITSVNNVNVYDDTYMKLLLKQPYVRKINSTDTVVLYGDIATLQFDFINYSGKGQLQYDISVQDYKSTSGTSGELFLPDIEPEKYYKVNVRVTDFIWESKDYSFYVYKEPYWWQAQRNVRIFWIAGILGFILFVYAIIIITRHYTYQASEKKNRLLDLELRAVYSQINPHFIFNTLSSALFFIDKKKFDEAYIHVSKFSKLLRSYLNSSQERFITLSEEISMLRNYIELQRIRFEERFDFDIVVENKIPADNVKIPSLLLQPLIENAINHGLFHKQGKGTLIISFVQGASSDELICIIEDDGVGRQRAAEIKQQNTVQYKSYGTKLTRRLIHIFNEYEDMNISMEYIDKHEPDTGTIVKLTIRNLKYEA